MTSTDRGAGSLAAPMYAKALGIVLRRVRYAEASLIVAWYTRERGRVRTVAKGALRPKSPLRAALDLFSVCRLVFHDRPGAELHILKEADLDRSYAALAGNLDAYHAGLYVLDLLDIGTADDIPEASLFDGAIAALDGLAKGYRHDVVVRFERVLLDALGRLPSLDCARCGRPAAAGGNAGWEPATGSLFCGRCTPPHARALPGAALRWWSNAAGELGDADAVALGVLTRTALDHALERRPRTSRHVPLHR